MMPICTLPWPWGIAAVWGLALGGIAAGYVLGRLHGQRATLATVNDALTKDLP